MAYDNKAAKQEVKIESKEPKEPIVTTSDAEKPMLILRHPQPVQVRNPHYGLSKQQAEHIADQLCKKIPCSIRMHDKSFTKMNVGNYALNEFGMQIPSADRSNIGIHNVLIAHSDGCQARIDLDSRTFATNLWVWLHVVAKKDVVPQLPKILTEEEVSLQRGRA